MKKLLLSAALLFGISLTASTVVNAQEKTKSESCCKKDEKKEKSCCSEKDEKGSCEKDGKSSKSKKGKKKSN